MQKSGNSQVNAVFDSPRDLCYVFIMLSSEYLRQVVAMLAAALEEWGKSEG